MLNFKNSKFISIIIFKRLYEKYPFSIIFPKIFATKIHSLNNDFIIFNLRKYVIKLSYNFNFFFSNYNNLICFSFISKSQFLKILLKFYKQTFSIKYNNVYLNSIILSQNKQLFLLTFFTFLKKLKYITFSSIKYLYSFLRFIKKIEIIK